MCKIKSCVEILQTHPIFSSSFGSWQPELLLFRRRAELVKLRHPDCEEFVRTIRTNKSLSFKNRGTYTLNAPTPEDTHSIWANQAAWILLAEPLIKCRRKSARVRTKQQVAPTRPPGIREAAVQKKRKEKKKIKLDADDKSSVAVVPHTPVWFSTVPPPPKKKDQDGGEKKLKLKANTLTAR